MDIINLIASLISGAIGGNMVGGALNLGGGIAGVILQSLGIATGSGSDALDAGSLIGNIAICGIGGALVTLVRKKGATER